MKNEKVWLSPPHMSGNELKYIQEALDQNWVAPAGPHIVAFEENICQYLDIGHAAATSSGTAALHLSLIALGVKQGDIVLCQSLTFAASANPIRYVSAVPAFIDSEPTTWNMCPDALETGIRYFLKRGKKPAAIICVHLYGMPALLDDLLAISNRYEIPLIEDAAEALGSCYHGRYAGTFGACGILSFNGNKIITTSSGGAMVSDSSELIVRSKFFASQAKDPAPHYQHSEIGYNYLMSNVCAGIGRAQLAVIDERVRQRRQNFALYEQYLGQLSGITFQPESPACLSNRWLTAITVDAVKSGINVAEISARLARNNIETRPVWKPMHLQPVFSGCLYFGGSTSEKLFEEGICLPSGSALAPETIHSIVREIIGLKRKRLPG